MKVYPLHPHPALLLEASDGRKYLAIADMHIGFESGLKTKGITIRSNLVNEMVEEIGGILRHRKVDGIILLGDVKNTVGTIAKEEWNDIPAFFNAMLERSDVYLVPGNHDSNIRFIVPQDVNVISSSGMVLEDTLLIHGHSMPSDIRSGVKRVVMGHIHPIFAKPGSLINGERVWIYLKVKKEAIFSEPGILDIVIVPSFNKYLYASMTEAGYRKSISPIITRALKGDNIQDAMIVTLDGSIVGDATMLQNII